MVCNVAARSPTRIKLSEATPDVPQQPLWPRPVGQLGLLSQCDGQHIGNCALLDDQGAVRIRFAEFELGVEQYAEFSGPGRESHPDRPSGTVAAGKYPAVRGCDFECPPLDKSTEQKLKQPVHRPPPSLKSACCYQHLPQKELTQRTYKRSDRAN